MRLIDVQPVLDYSHNKNIRACTVDLLEALPVVDAVPVVRGEWEIAIGYDPNKKVQCQNCYKMAYEPTSYCPNCGAKMEDKP
jgi:translation initiation factor 2 gamma subunit (eIF-2gamma)